MQPAPTTRPSASVQAIAFWVHTTTRGRPDMPSRKRRAAEAAVEAGAVPKPNGRPPTAYPNWDGERGCWVDDAGKERPSALPATVLAATVQHPEPAPTTAIAQSPPLQPRTLHAGLPSFGHDVVAADMQQRSMNVSDAWAHAIIVTSSVFCTILPRVDDPDPDTHLSHAMHERLSTYGLRPSAHVSNEEFWDGERTGRRRRWSV